VSTNANPRTGARYLPNLLSGLRLLAVPVLVVLAARHQEDAFGWLLIAALLTDVADGWIARAWSLESQLGALLDSLADTALMFVAIYGIWVFHREVMADHAIACSVAIGLWALEDLLALLRYGRLSSFHTYLSKIAANALGFFIGVLFVFGFNPWLFQLAIWTTILASLEELMLLAVLGEWRADVQGLWWVLSERRASRRISA
jgi:CDP-diacylglycerol--glycerol-3-phosphate 3-phosphatidyltransferase